MHACVLCAVTLDSLTVQSLTVAVTCDGHMQMDSQHQNQPRVQAYSFMCRCVLR